MFNLYQLVAGAHGGQGLESLAQQFGLSREQVDSAVQALMPALSTAFTAKAAQPGGLGEIAGAMTDDQHRQAFADPATAADPSTQQKGGSVVENLFANNAIINQVVAQASRYSGIPTQTLEQMLPVIVSMIMGGAATVMHGEGLGGLLGQLAKGGLGGMLGQFGGGATMEAGSTSGFPGMVGHIFDSFLGGHASAAGGAAPGSSSSAAGQATMPGLPPILQDGMDTLFKMFQPGVGPSRGQPDGGDRDR